VEYIYARDIGFRYPQSVIFIIHKYYILGKILENHTNLKKIFHFPTPQDIPKYTTENIRRGIISIQEA